VNPDEHDPADDRARAQAARRSSSFGGALLGQAIRSIHEETSISQLFV
jgi:hypothetical protein